MSDLRPRFHVYVVRLHVGLGSHFDSMLFSNEDDANKLAAVKRENTEALKMIGVHAVSVVPLPVY